MTAFEAGRLGIGARVSPEGIPWRDYRWRELAPALLGGLPLCLYWWALERTSRRTRPGFESLPDDAIIFMFHKNMHPLAIDKILSDDRGGPLMLGYHGLLSYLFSLPWLFIHAVKGFRYHRGGDRRPLDQIADFLSRHPRERMAMFTDTAGPYGVVRSTLIPLSVKTGRPLVALTYRISRPITLLNHSLPLPFSTLEARFSRVVTPDELRRLGRAESKRLLQELADRL